MVCDLCGKHEATVFMKQMVGKKVKKLCLCAECAASHGMDLEHSIEEILLGIGMNKQDGEGQDAASNFCLRCQMRYSDFKKTSRLGCPNCYEAFANDLAVLLESMHRGKEHVGKVPAGASQPAAVRTAAMMDLKQALQAAVKAENYEEAARLRDRLRNAEGKQAAENNEGS